MSYGDNEGPTNAMRPIRIYKTCQGCKYHKHTLVKSEHDPIYRDDCVHETAPKEPMKLSFSGNLNNFGDGVEPGSWCPFEPVNEIDLV